MHKEIERVILRITSKMERNRIVYNEAKEWYRDTGYDLYWNKMQKLEAEYEELKAFIGAKEEVDTSVETRTALELDELRQLLKNIKSAFFYLSCDLPDSSDLRNLKDLLREVN